MVLIPVFLFPKSPSLESAQYQLALELFKKNRYYDAITEFKRLLYQYKTKKYREKSYFYTGESYYSIGRYTDANKYLKLLYSRYPLSKLRHTAIYHIGRSLYMLSEYKDAIKYFDLYLKLYPSRQYADNSLYWKAESLLKMNKEEEAKSVLENLLKRYPYGNKTDAARFKLKLLAIEERMEKEGKPESKTASVKEEKKALSKAKPNIIIPEDYNKLKKELRKCWETEYQKEIKISDYKEEIIKYKKEITRLNNSIDNLRSENENLKEIGKGNNEEIQKQIDEKVKAFMAWENMLKIKEKVLDEKEQKLNEGFGKIYRINQMIEEENK